METLKNFENSLEIKRTIIDKACDVTESVELSFENDKLSFDDIVDTKAPVEEQEVDEEPDEDEDEGIEETPTLEIDNDTREKILKWLQQVYNAHYTKAISDTASDIWDAIHRADISYQQLDTAINDLYERVKRYC